MLFDADRASLLTAVMLAAIREFGIDTSRLHNDSTSISVHGGYYGADGTPRAGKPTPVITQGHSKDHRPDLKQLVWILTVSADGAVPITYRLADGNAVDDPTHVPTWDGLVALLGRVDFLYVADSKLCSRQAMGHIAPPRLTNYNHVILRSLLRVLPKAHLVVRVPVTCVVRVPVTCSGERA